MDVSHGYRETTQRSKAVRFTCLILPDSCPLTVFPHRPKTPKMKEGQDPSASIMELMKNMYQEGDDDMKRTIAKAWTESQEKKTKEGDLL